MNTNTLTEVAEILGNGYKCYADKNTGKVYAADQITLDERDAGDFTEYSPLEGPDMFKIMENYCTKVEDFGKQSELMEAMMYDQPFQSFKRKVYAIGLADEWIAFRIQRIIILLSE